ncbi:MAG: hypothetical protein KKH08_04500 [Candidatus Omnitrophica bacterium]|nr:hypothetical protein [Candidatus Omnitrophota bacterium]
MLRRKTVKIIVSYTAPLYPPLWGCPKRVWGLYANLGEGFDIIYVGANSARSKEYTNRKVKENVKEIMQPLCKMYYPFRMLELKTIKNLTFDIFTYLMMIFDRGFREELNSHEADI